MSAALGISLKALHPTKEGQRHLANLLWAKVKTIDFSKLPPVAASTAGDSWTDSAGVTGTAQLTYGHLGCIAVNTDNLCTEGSWPGLPAPAIWTDRLSQPERDEATFTRIIAASATLAATSLKLSAWADDRYTVRLNGTEIGSGDISAVSTWPVTLQPGTNTLSITVVNNPGHNPNSNPGGLSWKLEPLPK